MKKVIIFNKRKSFWSWELDVKLLNQQMGEIEKQGWQVISVTSNTNWLGIISSITILTEDCQ